MRKQTTIQQDPEVELELTWPSYATGDLPDKGAVYEVVGYRHLGGASVAIKLKRIAQAT